MIAPDNHTVQTNTGNTAWSFSFTTSGSERLIVVGTVGDYATSGVTYNGVSMTNPNTQTLTLAAVSLQFWYLIAPASGSNTLQVTPAAGAPAAFMAFVSSWTGVDQSTPLGTVAATAIDTQIQENVSVSPTLLNGETAVSIMCVYNRLVTATGQTLLDASNAHGAIAGAHAYKATPPYGTVACPYQWTGLGNQITAEIAYPIRPSAYPPPSGLKPNVMRPRPFKPGLAR